MGNRRVVGMRALVWTAGGASFAVFGCGFFGPPLGTWLLLGFLGATASWPLFEVIYCRTKSYGVIVGLFSGLVGWAAVGLTIGAMLVPGPTTPLMIAAVAGVMGMIEGTFLGLVCQGFVGD